MSRSIVRNTLETLVPERFDLLEELGSGSFGRVYRAFDKKHQVTAALKTLHQLDPEHLYQFKREFRSLANISHPNLVDLYELVAGEKIWFFTMSYIEGVHFRAAMRRGRPARNDHATTHERSPKEELAKTREVEDDARRNQFVRGESREVRDTLAPLDEEYLRETFRGLVTGVQALHEYGVLHRDLKPGNVLVTPEGRCVVLDFGLVTELRGTTDVRREQKPSSGLTGTPRYLAPELGRDVAIDEAVDWYGVGVMLYEVLAGRPPFEARTTVSELYQKNENSPPPIEEYRSDVDEGLCRLCMDLLASDPDERPDGREILDRLGEVPDQSVRFQLDPQLRRDSQTFVGRTSALETLRAAAEETAAKNGPSIVDIRGESGVGKTALAEQFLRDWRDEHPETLILQGRCYENESVPYKALDGVVDELVSWLERVPDDEFREYLGDGAQAVARLFPVLRRLDPVDQAPFLTEGMSEAQLRQEAFEVLSQVFRRIADERLVIVCIDDVQWGDEDSVFLLEHLLGSEHPPAVLLLTTWRGEDVEASSFLERYLQMQRELEETVRLEELTLGQLAKHDARLLAQRVVADSVERGTIEDSSDIDLDQIVEESGGNPLFVDELARYTANTGTVDSVSVAGFDAILEERLDTLPEKARRVLDLVALAGQPLSRELVRRAAGDRKADPSIFSRLRSERLTRVKGTEGEWLETYHDRIRDTVVDRLSDEAQRTLHLDLARTFESISDSDPETVAFHLEAAGRRDRAAEYFVDAADAAADTLAFDRAAQLFERALDVGDWSHSEEVVYRRRLGEMCASLGQSRRSAEAYFEAATAAEGLGVRECRIQAVEQLLRAGEVQAGTDLLYEELEALGFSPIDNRGLMLVSSLYRRWRSERRGFEFDVQPPEELDRRGRLLVEALTMTTMMHGIIDVPRGTYFHYHALSRALETGYPSRVALLLCQQVAQDVAVRTSYDRGEELLETARDLLPACEYERGRVRAYVELIGGMRDYFYSRWKPAQSAFRRAREILESEMPGSVWWRTVYLFFECDCHHRIGAFDELRRVVPETLEQTRERGDGFNTVLFRPKMALLAICDDEPGRAEEELSRAEHEWTQEGYHLHDFWRERVSIDAALYRGDLDNAWRRIREEWKKLRRSLLVRSYRLRTFALGLDGRISAALLGETSGWRSWHARYRTWRARRKLRATGTDCSEALADLVEAQLALSEGDDRAHDAFRRAQTGFEDADMYFHARALQLVRGQFSATDEVQTLEKRARRWMERKGIAVPDKMVRLVVPYRPRNLLTS